jgi:hypothetical protein
MRVTERSWQCLYAQLSLANGERITKWFAQNEKNGAHTLLLEPFTPDELTTRVVAVAVLK